MSSQFDQDSSAITLSSSIQWFAWLVCFLGALFYCYEYLLRTMPAIMEPELRMAFNLDSAGFGNLMGFYYYAYSPMQLPVGILIDRYGPRRLLVMAAFICAIGTYLFAAGNNLHISQFGRFLVGFGSAFAFVGFLKLATLWLQPKRFALISGLIMTLCMLGVTQGNVLIASLVKNYGWKDTSILFAGLGILIAVIMIFVLPSNNENLGHSQEKNPQVDLKMLGTQLLALVKNPLLWANGIIGCLLFLSLSGFAEAWGVSYFEQGRGYEKNIAVTLNNYVFWGWAIGGPFMGWISDKIQKRRLPLILGSLGAAISFASILYLPLNSPVWLMSFLLFMLGVCSSSEILIFPIARELSSKALAASALAFTNMLVMLGGIILQPGVGYLLKLTWSGNHFDSLPHYTLANYQSALLIISLGAMLAFFVTLWMKETFRDQ